MWSHHQTADKTDDRTHPSTLHQGQKLRSACDRCHHAKLKCSGGKPCAGCYDSREQCCYSVSHKPGRPKGVKNKRNFDQTGTRKTKTARANLSASTKPPQHQQRQPSSSVPSMVPTQDDAMPDFNNTQLDGPLTTEMLQDMSASLTSSGYSELLDLETGDELRKHSMPIQGYPIPDTLSLYTTFPSEESNASYVTPPSTATSEINLNNVSGPSIRSGSISTESEDIFALPQLYISSSPSSSSSVHTPDLLPTCNCLEQHTELLCLLKKLDQGQISVDSVLVGVQQALAPWQHLIQCRVCPHDGDQSVLFLAVMSIRSILRRLQRLYLANEYPSPPSGYSTPVRAQQGNSIGNVTLGSYKATDNEQKHITDLLVIHALGKIKYALLSLSDKFRQSRGRISASSLPDLTDGSLSPTVSQDIDPSCLQQLLQSLETTVQALVGAVRTRGS